MPIDDGGSGSTYVAPDPRSYMSLGQAQYYVAKGNAAQKMIGQNWLDKYGPGSGATGSNLPAGYTWLNPDDSSGQNVGTQDGHNTVSGADQSAVMRNYAAALKQYGFTGDVGNDGNGTQSGTGARPASGETIGQFLNRTGYTVGRQYMGSAGDFSDVLFGKDGKPIAQLGRTGSDDNSFAAMAAIFSAGAGAAIAAPGAAGAAGSGGGAGAAGAGGVAQNAGVVGATAGSGAGAGYDAVGLYGAGGGVGGSAVYNSGIDATALNPYGGAQYGAGGAAESAGTVGATPGSGAGAGFDPVTGAPIAPTSSAGESLADQLAQKAKDKLINEAITKGLGAIAKSGTGGMAAAGGGGGPTLYQLAPNTPLDGNYAALGGPAAGNYTSTKTKKTPVATMAESGRALARGASGANPIDDNGVQIGSIKALKSRIDGVRQRIAKLQRTH